MTPTDPGVQLPCTGNQGTSKMPSDSGPELTDLRFGVDRAGVATILFDRSGETLNTLSPGIFADLEAILEHCESNPAVRTVVVGSAKPGSFIAGADIRWLKTLKDADDPRQVSVEGQQMMDRLEDLTRKHGKPVVAAIEGPCLGGGLEVAMACSGRVALPGPESPRLQLALKRSPIPWPRCGLGGPRRARARLPASPRKLALRQRQSPHLLGHLQMRAFQPPAREPTALPLSLLGRPK